MNKLVGVYCEITSICNQSCPYCYNKKTLREHHEIPLESLKKMAQELDAMGSPDITLSGGEPFLRTDLYEILNAFEEEHIEVSFISNGECFEGNNMYLLTRYQPHLQLTFDGYNSETHDKTRGKGNFVRLINGIKDSRDKGFCGSIAVRINISNENINCIDSILNMLTREFEKEGGNLINTVNVAAVHSNGSYSGDKILPRSKYKYLADRIDEWNHRQVSKDSFTAAYDFLNPDIGCAYNGENGSVECGIRVDSKGDVFPCQLFSDPMFSIGNINQSCLREILSSDKMTAFIEQISSRKMHEPCHSCAYKAFCGCGCPAKSYMETGSIVSDYGCSERKEFFYSAIKKYLDEKQQGDLCKSYSSRH